MNLAIYLDYFVVQLGPQKSSLTPRGYHRSKLFSGTIRAACFPPFHPSSHKNFTLADVQRRKDSERRKRWHRGSHGVAVENRLRPKTPNRSSLATLARLTYLQSRGGKEVAAISPGIKIKSD
ncbi:hypothetical protein CEXT_623561 [Caerostris extrusa]|uniref:Uncharacterized protein n=1 Tax=Caerostris extrusa TaxID=172846 RepID=A0AAV4PK67_CAEEX|nr:hypothetical protein CEXT_623561 [Caerostris extrusa]